MLSAAAPAAQTVRYALKYSAEDTTMQVTLCLAQAAPLVRFEGDDDAPPFIDAIRRDDGSAPARDGAAWVAHDWHAGECLHYRAALGRIAAADRFQRRKRVDSDLMADPQTWLLQVDGAGDAEASVELPPGYSISTPWRRLAPDGATLRFRIPSTPLEWTARVAIGRFDDVPIALEGGVLHASVLGEADASQRKRLLAWLQRVARAAVAAYGRLALADVQVLVLPVGAQGEAVVFGQSTRGQGNALTLFVDPSQPDAAFDRDWVAVHELSHLFHPYLGDRGAWLAEGLATYYQNVLRARAGLLTPAQAWAQLDDGFARGRHQMQGNRTLEDASAQMGEHHDFQRIYWSGTAYWLDVDVELRRASGNRLSVDEALRRFGACCLPSERRWAPDEFVAKLDALTDSDAFSRTFRTFRARHDFPDLDMTYAQLGIGNKGKALDFDDNAPDSDIRRAIMAMPRDRSKPRTTR